MTNHLPKSKVTETTNLRLSSIVVRVTDLFEGQVVTIFVNDKITQNYSPIPHANIYLSSTKLKVVKWYHM